MTPSSLQSRVGSVVVILLLVAIAGPTLLAWVEAYVLPLAAVGVVVWLVAKLSHRQRSGW